MVFENTPLAGVVLIRIEPIADERGFFARSFSSLEFEAHGLPASFPQCNISFNRLRGTLRGMHFQRDPHPEGKLVRCTMGAAWDVAIDLRTDSPTYCQWTGFEITAQNRLAVYIPPGFAHGFQTLADDTELFYQMTEVYVPGFEAGVRWNDPAFTIPWPLANPVISIRDQALPDFVK